jgi:hypothetical protein
VRVGAGDGAGVQAARKTTVNTRTNTAFLKRTHCDSLSMRRFYFALIAVGDMTLV